jgi:hypothetical protein
MEQQRFTAVGVFIANTPVPLSFGHGGRYWTFGRDRTQLVPMKYLPLGTSIQDVLTDADWILNSLPKSLLWSGVVMFIDQEDINEVVEVNIYQQDGMWDFTTGPPSNGILLE